MALRRALLEGFPPTLLSWETFSLLIEIMKNWFYAGLVMEIIKKGQHKICRSMIGDPWTYDFTLGL